MEPPRRWRLWGLHLAAASRRTLIGIIEFAHARRKRVSVFEESVPSAPINATTIKHCPLTEHFFLKRPTFYFAV